MLSLGRDKQSENVLYSRLANSLELVRCPYLHDAFPKAELIVQREHYELARSGHPRFAAAHPHWDHSALRYRLIEGDIELLPGLSLLETGGHTPGHQSLLVRLPQTGLQRLFTPDRKKCQIDDNEEQLRASTQKFLVLASRIQCLHFWGV